MAAASASLLFFPSIAWKEGQEEAFLKGKFEPNFESLKQYQCPEWFRDAKFGIFLHWGVNSVPGFNGHYGRYMYWQGKPENIEGTGWNEGGADVYPHHVKTYGHPSTFGYKDFIPMWKAEKFDAGELARFFKSIGAKYVVSMAVHHDNFDNWDSKYHRWNSVKMGPQKDIIGEWEKACRKNRLKFGVSSHFNGGHENVFFQGAADFTGPLAGVPYDTCDPKYADFYHKRTPDRKKILPEIGGQFLNRHLDLISKYKPDLLYFDGGLPYGENGLKVAAHFYNTSIKAHGENQCVLNLKRDFPEGAATLDMEKGQADSLRELPWQTDTTINDGWFYLGGSKSAKYTKKESVTQNFENDESQSAGKELRMNAGQVIHNMVDIVSKNGNMLLNVGPRADGSLPESYIEELKKVGEWLKVNGEAVYESRPWKIFGEGPTMVESGNFKEPDKPFAAEDIRFTAKGKTLYAICLGVPSKEISINSLGVEAGLFENEISEVSLLGCSDKINWKRSDRSLWVGYPAGAELRNAIVLKIEG